MKRHCLLSPLTTKVHVTAGRWHRIFFFFFFLRNDTQFSAKLCLAVCIQRPVKCCLHVWKVFFTSSSNHGSLCQITQDQKLEKAVTKRKKREYMPQKGSGGYAVLLALYRHSQVMWSPSRRVSLFDSAKSERRVSVQTAGSKGFMFKIELQAQAQHLCHKSFTVVSSR